MNTRVRELREKQGLTQLALAQRVGSSQQAISRIEKGDIVPPLDIIVNLAEYFRVTIEYMIFKSDTKQNIEIQLEVKRKIDENEDIVVLYEQLDEDSKGTVKVLMNRLVEVQKRGDKLD